MAAGPATPPAEEPPGAGGTPPPGEERYGPLALLRTRKQDGRSLILYSVAVHQRPDTETAPAERPAAGTEQERRA